MADYFWVGGSGTWDNSSTTNWASTSGGSGGAGVPTNADTATFDTNSAGASATVTVASTAVSLSTSNINGFINFSLSGSPTLCTTAGTFTFTRGTITLNNNTLSTGIFSSDNGNTRSIDFGSGNIALTSTVNAIILNFHQADGFTWTGTGAFTRNMVSTASIRFGSSSGGTASNAPNLTVNAGSSTLTITSGSSLKNVIFTGSTCTVSATNVNIAGNLTLASGGTYTSVDPIFIGSGTVTSLGKTVRNVTINGAGITVTLADAMTVPATRTFTLTQGTLDLAGFTLSCPIFSSDNSNTRSVVFGSGNIALTSTVNATVILSMATATNFTCTGTGAFTRNMTNTATMNFGATAGATASNAPNLSVTAGSTTITFTSGSSFKNINFTGYTSSNATGAVDIYGNLTLASVSSYLSFTPTFKGTSTLTSNFSTVGDVIIDGAGITVTLADTFTQSSNSTLTLTRGTFDAANRNVTPGSFSSSNSNTRALIVGTGTWDVRGASWNIATSTGLTLTPSTSIITMSSSAAKAFSGGGLTYYNLNTEGAGTLTISGSNTFNTISSINYSRPEARPYTVTFTAGTTQTVTNFSLAGLSSSQRITINSTTPGTQFTLSKASGTVNASFLSIQDSNATGGAVWNAGVTNVNGGNNLGWIFPATASGNMFLMFS